MKQNKVKLPNLKSIIKDQELITVKRETPLDEALELMLNNDIYHLPVVDDQNRLVGMLSERDMRWAMASPVLEPTVDFQRELEVLKDHTVRDFMTPLVHYLTQDESVLQACRIMRENKIGGLPVTDAETHQILGIVTENDLLDHLASVILLLEA